jgi:hypothetical protein
MKFNLKAIASGMTLGCFSLTAKTGGNLILLIKEHSLRAAVKAKACASFEKSNRKPDMFSRSGLF